MTLANFTKEHSWGEDPSIAQTVEGEGGQLATSDLSATDLLRLVLIELKKIEIHLAALSGEEVNDDDIEGID